MSESCLQNVLEKAVWFAEELLRAPTISVLNVGLVFVFIVELKC